MMNAGRNSTFLTRIAALKLRDISQVGVQNGNMVVVTNTNFPPGFNA